MRKHSVSEKVTSSYSEKASKLIMTKTTDKKNTNQDISTAIKANEKNQAIVTVSISQKLLSQERQHVLEHLGSQTTIKGFRQGKAPLELVEKELDPQKITDHLIKHILPQALNQIFKDHQLQPLSYPKAKLLNTSADADWELEFTIPLKPTITLGDYKKILSQAQPTKIWTPGDEKQKDEPKDDQGKKLQTIFNSLLKNIQFDVPSTLVEEEVNHSLSRLLGQTQTLGLTVEAYLQSINKTPEQIRQDYTKAAEDNLRLELILDAIADDLKISATEKEIEDLISASGDEKAKQKLDTADQKRHIKGILRQRKTIDALLKL